MHPVVDGADLAHVHSQDESNLDRLGVDGALAEVALLSDLIEVMTRNVSTTLRQLFV